MEIQFNLERGIHHLVHEFLQEPYRFFTEADVVARFHQILEADALLSQRVKSRDGFPLSMIHQEYPTFFRFDDSNPTSRLDTSPQARRGHHDIAILAPAFIRAHNAETVKNRDIANERIRQIEPFQAVVEFKLDDQGWSSGRKKGAIAEMGKLNLSREEAGLRYLVVLMRYTASTETRWNKYWPEVTQAAMESLEIRSIFATHRTQTSQQPYVRSFGDWLVQWEEGRSSEMEQSPGQAAI